MIDPNKKIPMYLQIKDEIITMIEGMGFDQQLPSEISMADTYNVSRGTVKQAILELVYEEKLYRVQGKGTFVSPPKIKRTFKHLPSFTNDIERVGYVPESQVLKLEEIDPPDHVRAKLQLPEKARLIYYCRMVRISDKPVALVTSYLSSDQYPDLAKMEIGTSLYDTLNHRYHKMPISVDDTYTPRNVDEEIARSLQIQTGDAIFYSERVASLEDGTPVEYVESYIRSDQFTLNLRVSQPDNEKKDTAYFGFHFESNEQ